MVSPLGCGTEVTWSRLLAGESGARQVSGFEFEDGPPTTSHELNGWGDNLVHEHLHAASLDQRVAVLYSNKDYSSEWGFHPESKRLMSVDPTRFAVNLVVYALSR